MSFIRNFNYKPDFTGKKSNDNKKELYDESASNELLMAEMYMSTRDVCPQFSEPEEYSFSSKICSASFKVGSSESQNNKNLQVTKNNSVYNRTINGSNSAMSRQTVNQHFPTFRQYNDDQINGKGYLEEKQKKRKFPFATEVSCNESEGDSTIIPNRSEKIPPKFCENSETRSRNIWSNELKNQKALIGTRTRYLIGTVDQVIRWYKMAKNMEYELHYEIAGVLESKIKKDCMDLLFIRSESGHILQGVFYNIDRELPDLQLGNIISATGSMIGSNKLQIFDATVMNKDDFISIHRLAFLSQRSLQEAQCTPIY